MDMRESKQDVRFGMQNLVVRFTLFGARGMASRSVFQQTNKTRLGVSEPWQGVCVALHTKFTESRIILLGKLIHKFTLFNSEAIL